MGGSAVRLVHTADVHIGSDTVRPGVGEHLAESCICPIHAIVDTVRSTSADALIIAGDLFDHGRAGASTVAATFELLGSADVPVVLLPGNHDVYDDSGLFRRFRSDIDRAGVMLIEDLDGTTGTILDGRVSFWGRAMAEHTPQFFPLAGSPERPDPDAFHIVLGHGLFVGDEGNEGYRSSPISSDDLHALDADYVALGHVHVDRDLSCNGTTVFYPGAPFERREPGSVRVVDLHETGVTSIAHQLTHDGRGCGNRAMAGQSSGTA